MTLLHDDFPSTLSTVTQCEAWKERVGQRLKVGAVLKRDSPSWFIRASKALRQRKRHVMRGFILVTLDKVRPATVPDMAMMHWILSR